MLGLGVRLGPCRRVRGAHRRHRSDRGRRHVQEPGGAAPAERPARRREPAQRRHGDRSLSLALEILSGQAVSATGMVLEFVRIVGGGLAIGVLIGLGISQIIRQIDDPMIEITLTTLAAYGSFLAAEQLGFSGRDRDRVGGNAVRELRGAHRHVRRPRGLPPRPSGSTSRSRSTRSSSSWSACTCTSSELAHLELILAAYAAVTLARAGVVFGVLGARAGGGGASPGRRRGAPC